MGRPRQVLGLGLVRHRRHGQNRAGKSMDKLGPDDTTCEVLCDDYLHCNVSVFIH